MMASRYPNYTLHLSISDHAIRDLQEHAGRQGIAIDESGVIISDRQRENIERVLEECPVKYACQERTGRTDIYNLWRTSSDDASEYGKLKSLLEDRLNDTISFQLYKIASIKSASSE